VDSKLETPLNAKLFEIDRPVWIYSAYRNDSAIEALTQRGANIQILPNPSGKVDLAALLDDLGQRGINELHVEAGHKLNGSFLREGLVDELLVYVAPKLLGQGQGMTSLGPFEALDQAHQLTFHEITRAGDDLRLLLRKPD
jgi:diaminohydroxyphosphoribosylaminopyrimidine deaminase/5-amino-6-(5-phosphoribosylamino)uracil reductase